MKRAQLPAVALLLAAVCCGGSAQAQSSSNPALPTPNNERNQQLKNRMQQELGLLRDEDPSGQETDAARRANLDAFFRRLSGRFRIEGQIERVTYLRDQESKITGVADCSGVGEGTGVHCILSATWPPVERRVMKIGANDRWGMLDTFTPAVLVLGLDPDKRQVQSQLVTADSVAHGWSGKVVDNTLRARNLAECQREEEDADVRCFRQLQITAEPESEVVEILLAQSDGIDIRFTLHRDADARASKKQKSLRAR